MKRIQLIVVLAVLVIAFVAALMPGESLAANCLDLLNNNVYRCKVKSSFGGEFTDCFRFVSPGVISTEFDLNVDGLFIPQGCSCQAKGTFNRPVFDASPSFDCVTSPEGGFNYTFQGKVTVNGKKIKGQATNQDGTSHVWECELDPFCSLPTVQSAGESLYGAE